MNPYALSILSGNTFQTGDVSIRVFQAKNVTIIANSQVGNTVVAPTLVLRGHGGHGGHGGPIAFAFA